MSTVSDEIANRLQHSANKVEVLKMIAFLLIDQIRLLEENAANRQKALSQWHPSNS